MAMPGSSSCPHLNLPIDLPLVIVLIARRCFNASVVAVGGEGGGVCSPGVRWRERGVPNLGVDRCSRCIASDSAKVATAMGKNVYEKYFG